MATVASNVILCQVAPGCCCHSHDQQKSSNVCFSACNIAWFQTCGENDFRVWGFWFLTHEVMEKRRWWKSAGQSLDPATKWPNPGCQLSSLLGIVTALASFCLPLLNAYHKSSQLTSNSATIPLAGCDKAGWSDVVRPHVLVLYEQLLEQGESKCDWYGFVNGGYPQMAIFQYGKWGFKPNLGPYFQTSLASLEDGRWQARGLNVSMAMIQRNCLVDIHIAYHQVPQKIATGSSPQKERR